MKNRRTVTGRYFILTSVVAAIILIAGCKKEEQAAPPAREVKVVAAAVKDVPLEREWTGELMGAVDVEIRARVDGWLTAIHFQDGTQVKKGQLLYSIDPTEREQAVAEAKGRLAAAQTLRSRAEADVNRYTPLAASGAVSKRDLERAEAELGARSGEVDAASASLRLAEVNLGYAQVYSPIDGLIGISRARVGDYVGRPPNPVVLNTVSRVDSVHARFSVTEQEYLEFVRRAAGQKTSRDKIELSMVLSDGSVYPRKGYAIYSERQVDAATGTLRIDASFPNPQYLLRPGQFARIRAVVDTKKNAVVVPSKALTELQGQYQAYVVGPDNKTQLRAVTVSSTTGGLAVIETGIKGGENVVVEGSQLVRPDMPVTPVVLQLDSLVSSQPPAGGK